MELYLLSEKPEKCLSWWELMARNWGGLCSWETILATVDIRSASPSCLSTLVGANLAILVLSANSVFTETWFTLMHFSIFLFSAWDFIYYFLSLAPRGLRLFEVVPDLWHAPIHCLVLQGIISNLNKELYQAWMLASAKECIVFNGFKRCRLSCFAVNALIKYQKCLLSSRTKASVKHQMDIYIVALWLQDWAWESYKSAVSA